MAKELKPCLALGKSKVPEELSQVVSRVRVNGLSLCMSNIQKATVARSSQIVDDVNRLQTSCALAEYWLLFGAIL